MNSFPPSSHYTQPTEWEVPGSIILFIQYCPQTVCVSQNILQVAMVPYRMESGQLIAIAPPSCSARSDLAGFGVANLIYSKVTFSSIHNSFL